MSKSTATVKSSRKSRAKVAPVVASVDTQSPVTVDTDAPVIDAEYLANHDAMLAEALALVTRDEPAPEVDEPAPVTGAPVTPFSALFVASIVARMGEQSSKDLDTSLSNARKSSRAIDTLYAQPAWAGVLDTLRGSIEVSDKRNTRFIAVKALVKIVAALSGIAAGVRSEFDPYSRTIIANLVTLAGITNKSALVCLSRSVVYDELEAQQALTRHYNCSASTASTQASSTRMMLMHLDLCAVVKGKRADVTTAHDDARTIALLAMFAGK